MAEGDSAKKKSKHPYGAMFWGAVGLAAAFRALYHPWRALVKDGFPSRCAGTSCDPSMGITAFSGLTEVYSPVRGRVAIAKTGTILIIPDDEGVVLEYRSSGSTDFVQQVKSGDEVGAGQQIAVGRNFSFAVWQLDRTTAGAAKMGKAIEPASWLATHGARVSATYHKNQDTWCAAGRKLVVPQALASQCGMILPPPNGYAILPISATMA